MFERFINHFTFSCFNYTSLKIIQSHCKKNHSKIKIVGIVTRFSHSNTGTPSDNETAFATWARESYPKDEEEEDRSITTTSPRVISSRSNLKIVFLTINGDVSVSASDLSILQNSVFFSDILTKANEQTKPVFEVNVFHRTSSESLKTMLEIAMCFRSPQKENLPIDTMTVKAIYGLCVRCDLMDLKDLCDSILLKDLDLDSAVEYLNLAIMDSYFLQGAYVLCVCVCVCVCSPYHKVRNIKKKNRYKGKRLVHRCSGLILENFTKVSEVGGTNEEWGTVVEFVITELKRRLSHSECVIQRPPPPPPVVVLECELPARAVSVSCT